MLPLVEVGRDAPTTAAGTTALQGTNARQRSIHYVFDPGL